MAEYTLPIQGETPWGEKLNAAINAINTDVETRDKGYEHHQTIAMATWTIPVPSNFTRIPSVTLYTDSGELIETDIQASTTEVVVTFPAPYTGKAILS